MNIDFKVTDILPDRWWNLTRDVLSDKKFDKEEFETLFKETFEVLRHCVCEDCVNKELIELIKNVSGFVATRFAKVNYWHLAACELTDAMLTNCLQGETQKKPMTKGKWVLLTTEIGVDFMNVDEMLFNFSEDLAYGDMKSLGNWIDELDLILAELDMNPIQRNFAWLKEAILLAIYEPDTWQKSYLESIGNREGITRERVRQILSKVVWDHWSPKAEQILRTHFGNSIQTQFEYVKPNHIEFITLLSEEFREKYPSFQSK